MDIKYITSLKSIIPSLEMQNRENGQINFGEIDLVDMNNQFSIFMYVNDLAYKQFPEQFKHYTIDQHNEDVKSGKKPNSYPENENHLDLTSLFKIIMRIFWKHSIDFSVIDIGSQYGSFSMSLGAYIKKTEHENIVYAFDCGIASNLCQKNIKLNLLEDMIKFEKKAVSDSSSPQQVFFDLEHSEDNHIVERGGTNLASYIVEGITLDDYFKDHKENFVIKIDTQGAEPLVFHGMRTVLLKKPIILFEFTPWTFDLLKTNPVEFLKTISEEYVLFELEPSTEKIFELNRDHLEEFVKSVSESVSKWTDLLILNRKMEVYDEILNKITKAENYCGMKFNVDDKLNVNV